MLNLLVNIIFLGIVCWGPIGILISLINDCEDCPVLEHKHTGHTFSFIGWGFLAYFRTVRGWICPYFNSREKYLIETGKPENLIY